MYYATLSNQTKSRFDRFFAQHEHNLVKFKHNTRELLRSSKSFVLDRFVYTSDREMERGAHWLRTRDGDEHVPLSAHEFGVELRYMVNGDTARVTRKYATLSHLLKKTGGGASSIEEEEDYIDFLDDERHNNNKISNTNRRVDEETRSEMAKIRMSHILPFNRLVASLFNDLVLKPNDNLGDDLSVEKLNFKFKRDTLNKGYFVYRRKVNILLWFLLF